MSGTLNNSSLIILHNVISFYHKYMSRDVISEWHEMRFVNASRPLPISQHRGDR